MVFTSLHATAELQGTSGYSVWHNMADKQETKFVIHPAVKPEY
jgi:hypothetical protein